jgi:predicted phage tail protein
MVRMVFSYPAGLISKGVKQWYDGLAAYKIEIAIDKGDGFGDFNNVNSSGDFTYHVAATSSSFFLQEDISLDVYKPFKDFKIKITRASRDDLGPQQNRGYDLNNSVSLNSVWTTTTCIIRERLNYPYTAHAQVRCNAKQFKNIPKRSYECKGRLIQVPSNYITRDKSTDGIAHYRRVSSNGSIHATDDQDWDGSFQDLIYTDNPAWVFYDIITNDRYGLGTWINTTDIDKYALYRIARYCDELVPDGKGGTEPRFLANIYLTKATEAYKVLKDMATTFRAILFWSQGNIVPVIDQERDPIYNFTKGNVIEGKFQYEGTGSKVRSNQVAVTWNNPENDYVPEVLLVEDRENIVKTGKILIEEAVAYGATSIGQATRYGRWKLWTAINQQEIVSFKTAISGAFIGPGDVINVQDADRYDTAYSGRISNTGTLSTTVVPLDRTIILNSGSVYELSVLIQEPAPRLAQDTATISTVVYNMGDIIPGSYTEETASNIQDDDGTVIQIVWAPYTHVQSKTVSTNAGSVASLTVSAAFSYAPDREAIWLLKETVTSSGLEREGSKKMYKILGITESKKTEFSITAVEHFNEKFDAVDEDFGRPYVDTLLAPTLVVPAPTNVGTDIF